MSKTKLSMLGSAIFTLVAIVALAFAFFGGVPQEAHAQDAQKGLQVVSSNGCVGCHGGPQLAGGGAPKLAGTKLSKDQFLAKVRSGGGRMPAFSADKVSDAAVADAYAYAVSLANAPASQATTTTVAATTAAATTAAATTAAATTAAATTQAATTAVATSTTAILPPTQGVTEVTLPASVGAEFTKQLGAAAGKASFKFYVSNETTTTLATTLNKSVTGAGYTSVFPNGFQNQGGTLSGAYTKASAPDLVVVLVDIPANSQEITKGLNVSPQDAAAFATQVAGRRTLVVALAGNNLFANLAGSATTAAATTAPATTRAAGGQGGAPTGAPATGVGGSTQDGGLNALWLLLPLTLITVMSGAALVTRSRRARR